MKQFTPKTLEQALLWIHTNRHYEVGQVFSPGYAGGWSRRVGMFYRNSQETMRVMDRYDWAKRFHNLLVPETRAHDDRMYRVTKHGRTLIRGLYDKREHP